MVAPFDAYRLKHQWSASPWDKRPFFLIQRHRVDDNGPVTQHVFGSFVVKGFHGIPSGFVQAPCGHVSFVGVNPCVLVSNVPCFPLERIEHPSSEPFPSILGQHAEPSKPSAFRVSLFLVYPRQADILTHRAIRSAERPNPVVPQSIVRFKALREAAFYASILVQILFWEYELEQTMGIIDEFLGNKFLGEHHTVLGWRFLLSLYDLAKDFLFGDTHVFHHL